MTHREYEDAYRDGAVGMRDAIRANLENLQKRMLRDKEEGKIPSAADFDIQNHFTNVFNMVDIRVDGEPDKADPDAYA